MLPKPNPKTMILCVGLSPAMQRTMIYDAFRVGEVNRARRVIVTASGKGVNVARVLTTLGANARLVHPLGGASGRFVADTLDEAGIFHDVVWDEDDTPTRTCTTLLSEGGETTELVEEAAPLAFHDGQLIKAAIVNGLLQARAVCLSGSLPQGLEPELYARIVREAHAFGISVVVDAQKEPLLAALPEGPFLVKPNREEALQTLGISASGKAEADAETAVSALTVAGAAWALVSMGKAGSLLGDIQGNRWRITPPDVSAVNPIGSGDSLAAGLLFAYVERGQSVPDAAAFGTACAAANCLSETSGVVDPADVEMLLPRVGLTRL